MADVRPTPAQKRDERRAVSAAVAQRLRPEERPGAAAASARTSTQRERVLASLLGCPRR